MEEMEKRERFINRLLDKLGVSEGPRRDTYPGVWFLMHSAYQEGYADGLMDGYRDAVAMYSRPIPFSCCDPFEKTPNEECDDDARRL